MKKKTFGVSMTMSSQELVVSQPDEDWTYTMLGHFGGIILRVVENLEEFTKPREPGEKANGDKEYTAQARLRFQPEFQKLFFCVQDNRADTKKNRMKEYADGIGHNYLALIAVKMRPRHASGRQCCTDLCTCIENKINKLKDENGLFTNEDGYNEGDDVDCIVMRSLSVDDVYILIGMKKPWFNCVMDLTQHLNDWVCKFDCENSSIPQVNEALVRINKGLEQELNNHDEDMSLISDVSWVDAYKNSLKYCVDLLDDIKTNIKKLPICDKLIGDITAPLRRMWDDANPNWDDANPNDEECERRTEETYRKMKILLDGINVVRCYGEVPVILKTYTAIGYKSTLNKNDKKTLSWEKNIEEINENGGMASPCPDNKKINLNIQVVLRPGYRVSEAISKLKEWWDDAVSCRAIINVNRRHGHNLGEENKLPELETVNMTLGKHDYALQIKLSPIQLVYFYTQHWIGGKTGGMSATHSSLGQISSSSSTGQKQTDSGNKTMELDDTHLAMAWIWADQRYAAKMFEKINVTRMLDIYPILKPLLHEISLLQIQGCHKFFEPFSWIEFQEARKFFESIYRQLDAVLFHDITKHENNFEYVETTLWDLKKVMEQCLHKLSDLFQDRMILDMSMRENTRPGVYAAGAYEAVLHRYGLWVERITSILREMEAAVIPLKNIKDYNYGNTAFMVAPAEHSMIESNGFFHSRFHGEGRVVIYELPFKDMLDFDNALAAMVHEVGHYWGIIAREDRYKAYIKSVSRLFAQRLGRILCLQTDPTLPFHSLMMSMEALATNMEVYFIKRIEESGICEYLHHIRLQCNQAINHFFNHAFNNLKPNDHDPLYKLMEAFVDLYHDADAESMVTVNSYMFRPMIEKLIIDCFNVSQTILREANADLCAIRLLTLDGEQALNLLLHGIKQRAKLLLKSRACDDVPVDNHILRIATIILLTDPDPINTPFKDVWRDIESKVMELVGVKEKWKGAERLRKNIQARVNNNDLLSACEPIAKHLFDVNKKIIQWMTSCISDSDVGKKITDLKCFYDAIKSKADMDKLLYFLSESRGT